MVRASVGWQKVPLLIIVPESMFDEVSHLSQTEELMFVGKPFSPDVLVKKIEGIIERMLQLASGGDADESD